MRDTEKRLVDLKNRLHAIDNERRTIVAEMQELAPGRYDHRGMPTRPTIRERMNAARAQS